MDNLANQSMHTGQNHILLFVCLFSGPATEDKHFLWLFISFQLVLSTSWVLVALTKYQKAFDNVQKRKVKVGFEAFTSNAMVAIWNIDLAEMRSPAETIVLVERSSTSVPSPPVAPPTADFFIFFCTVQCTPNCRLILTGPRLLKTNEPFKF